MTESDLEIRARFQAKKLEAWRAKAARVITSKIDDAHAHAEKAITDTLKAVPDGRHTLRKASRSASFKAALKRLDELTDRLVGPSVASLDGLVRDAREDFYREAFESWKPLLRPQDMLPGDPDPTNANVRYVRGCPLHGMELRSEIGSRINGAKRDLNAAVNVAGHSTATDRKSRDLLKDWRDRSERAIAATVNLCLSDSLVFADREAGRDLVKPELRNDDVIDVGS